MQMTLYSFVLYHLLSRDKIVSSGNVLYLFPKNPEKNCELLLGPKVGFSRRQCRLLESVALGRGHGSRLHKWTWQKANEKLQLAKHLCVVKICPLTQSRPCIQLNNPIHCSCIVHQFLLFLLTQSLVLVDFLLLILNIFLFPCCVE